MINAYLLYPSIIIIRLVYSHVHMTHVHTHKKKEHAELAS